MTTTRPSVDLANVALERTEGSEFERFAQSFLAATIDTEYVPLGGLHDGGADGLTSDTILQHGTRSGSFMQASIEAEPKQKIRSTVKRLREVGREPSQLLYVTNRTVRALDLAEEELSNELDVAITIRDGRYIATQVSTSSRAAAAYYEHLHHRTAFLEGVGRGAVLTASAHVTDPYVYTFLVSQLERESSSESSFLDGIVDAMIVHSLEGTDPDAGVLMDESQIRAKILSSLPQAEPLLVERLRPRLEAISKKPKRRIRWHQAEDRFALPYDQRKQLQKHSLEDEALRVRAKQEIADDLGDLLGSDHDVDLLADLTLATIQRSLEKDGLRFAKFLVESDPDDCVVRQRRAPRGS